MSIDEFDYEEEIQKSEEEDYSEYDIVNTDQMHELLSIPSEPIMHIVPLDHKRKLAMKFWVREATIDEQLRLLEVFFAFDQKSGEAKMKWLPYYREAYRKMVKRSEPTLTWKEAHRRYGAKFMQIVMKIIPSPFTLSDGNVGGVTEKEEKNS